MLAVLCLMGLTGTAYFLVALFLGVAFLGVSLRFAIARTRYDARVLFFDTVEQVIVPGLEAKGLPAARAWKAAQRELGLAA